MCLMCGDDLCDVCLNPIEDWVMAEGGTVCGCCQLFNLLGINAKESPNVQS